MDGKKLKNLLLNFEAMKDDVYLFEKYREEIIKEERKNTLELASLVKENCFNNVEVLLLSETLPDLIELTGDGEILSAFRSWCFEHPKETEREEIEIYIKESEKILSLYSL